MLRIFRGFTWSRFYSIKHAAKPPVKYTGTIHLPKTKFPNHLSSAKRQQVESELLERVLSNAYQYQEQHNREPTFVLHDGPPYANGDLHMGHAVNKILKDVTLRQHVVRGQKVQYIPGWDCHGLPIELKAMTAKEPKEKVQDANSIRQKSRQFALAAMQRQKDEFRSWGILSDWNNAKSIYLTLRPDFIIKQLQLFLNFYERGLVYRDLKPVYWSPSSRTALAEAELEYDANFVSPSVYVRFALTQLPNTISIPTNAKVYALVWTTTPWTLPSNQAICYNSTLEYKLVKLQNNLCSDNELYLIAANVVNDFVKTTATECVVVDTLRGADLHRCRYKHPIFCEQHELPFYAAAHVQDTKGTGLVHTAPAHGHEDFLVSLEQKLPVKCFVNEEGVYTVDAPAFLRGNAVLEVGDSLVMEHIVQDVIHAGKLTHSYPIDWRTKKPVIIRASEQWFMNTEQLKARAVEEIKKINIYPRMHAETSRNALLTQVQKRPYWCISRQRVWGVPIPVFYERNTKQIVVNKALVAQICKLIAEEGGVDFWWSKSIQEILPDSLLQELKLNAEHLVKGADIFDIWFDSGSTWCSVLKDAKIADVYLEGYDQFSGWFQSSLLTSIAARDCAPYKSLFVHGFTVDEKGHKMSKSLGNVISPKDITDKYGVDALRWWVASHGVQNVSITVSDKLLQQAADSVSKVRATLRYLNGVIGIRSAAAKEDALHKQGTYLSRYLLSALVDFEEELEKLYSACEYNRAVAVIQNFLVNQVSAIYVHLIKDRLYCGDNVDLQMIRYTLTRCYEVICKALWPIMPFTVEESWSYYDNSSAFYQQLCAASSAWKDLQVEQVLNSAFDVKRLLNQKTTEANSWTLSVDVTCTNAITLQLLQQLQTVLDVAISDSELCEILQVQSVTLSADATGTQNEEISVDVRKLEFILCPRCRRYAVERENCTCVRCAQVLSSK